MDDIINFHGESIFPYYLEQSILEFAKQFDSAIYFVIVTKNRLHIRVETHNSSNKPTVKSINDLRKKLAVPLKVHICTKGELLDTGFFMRSPEVYKPTSISDWRTKSIRSVTLTEALIKWKDVGFYDFIDIIWRFLKNAIQKKILK